jgi:hypothetical protein
MKILPGTPVEVQGCCIIVHTSSSLQSFVREFSLVLEEVGLHSSPLPSKVYMYMAIVLWKKIKIHTPQRRK